MNPKKHPSLSVKKTAIFIVGLFVLPALVIAINSCGINYQNAQTAKETTVAVDTIIKNMGELTQFKQKETSFRIKNTGDAPLLINKVKADCHCTGVSWDTTMVQPNDFAVIKVTYDSRNIGIFQQAVDVDLNTKEKHLICLIRGTVVPVKKTF